MITRNSPIVGECCSGAGTTTSVVAQRSETGDMKDRGGKNTSRARQDSESDTRCNSFGGYDEFLFPNGSFGELGEFHIAMLEEQWGRDEVHLSLDPVEVDTLMMSAIKDEVKEMNVGESKAPVQCVTKPRARPAKAAQMKQNTRLKNEKVEDPQKRLAKARQKRYRENVKSKMKTVEEEVVKGESEIQSLREENARLKAVNANLERNMDDRRLCKEAFLRHAAGTKVIQVMNTTDGIKYETIENGGKAVEVLEEISNLSQEVPPSDLIEDFAVKIALDPAMHTKEKTVITLQKKLRILLDAYHNVSLDKSLIERKIVNIFTIRRHVASAILIFRPELVIEKLSDGWVGEDFADFGSVQLDTNAIELLVESLELTPAQVQACKRLWQEYLSIADQYYEELASQHNALNPSHLNTSDDNSRYSIFKLIHRNIESQHALKGYKTIVTTKLEQMIDLAWRMQSALHPIQLAKLCTFYPGHFPSVPYTLKVLSQGIRPLSESNGHLIASIS